jgi:hypothetical protein
MSRTSIVAAAILASCGISAPWGAAHAAADVVTLTSSFFPERPWTPISAADGALAGAGRATDPSSSWSLNPATMARAGLWRVRGTALAVDPQRNDLRASTLDYSDTSPFVNVGECALHASHNDLGFALYLAQDAYQQSKEQYISSEPGFGPLSFESQTETNRARYGFSAGATRGAWSGGLAIEGHVVHEKFDYMPSQDAQNLGAVPAKVDLTGHSVGGAAGVAWQASPLVLVAADGRVAGSPRLEDSSGNTVGSDQIPAAVDFGVTVGKELGGHFLGGASYQGARDVALGDSVGRGTDHDPARWNLAGSYYYKPHEAPWDFRAGFGWSPFPGEGAPRYSRMGVGLGYDFSGILARISYSRDARYTADHVNTSRNWFTFGFDLKL